MTDSTEDVDAITDVDVLHTKLNTALAAVVSKDRQLDGLKMANATWRDRTAQAVERARLVTAKLDTLKEAAQLIVDETTQGLELLTPFLARAKSRLEQTPDDPERKESVEIYERNIKELQEDPAYIFAKFVLGVATDDSPPEPVGLPGLNLVTP